VTIHRERGQRGRPIRAGGRLLAAACALLLGPAASAADRWVVPLPLGIRDLEPRASLAAPSLDRSAVLAAVPRRSGPPSHFDQDRLMSRVALPLESISAFQGASLLDDRADHVMSRELSREVRRGLESTTRRALKDYLLQTTSVDQRLELWADRKRGGGGAVAGAPRSRRVDFDAGFDGFAPEVEMRYAVPYGSFRMSVDAGGEVSLRYRVHEDSRAELGAGVDGDGAYNLGLRISF
jgi:hypothetical protein